MYSARPELAALVDAAVLVTVDDTARRARLAARGHDHGDWPTRWEAAEDWYFAQCRPPAALDAVVAGA